MISGYMELSEKYHPIRTFIIVMVETDGLKCHKSSGI
jgi:hypothetical protein